MKLARERLSDWLKDHSDLDGFLITKAENVRWLTGFGGSFGMVLFFESPKPPFSRGLTLITDGRYEGKARPICKNNGFTFVLYDKDFSEQFGQNVVGNIAVEDSLTLQRLESLKKQFPNAQLTPQKSVLETLRRQKIEDEITKIRTAQEHVDALFFPFLTANLKAGVTERSVAYKLEQAIRAEGRFCLSFDSIVAFGENSAIPHHKPGERALRDGDNVLIDCGAIFDGYCSDMTRNVGFGAVSSAYQNHYDHLLSVQETTLQRFRAGTKTADLDQFARDELSELAEYFTHSLGHGVGLEIHEAPSLSTRSEAVLEKDEVVTCEPGIYFPGQYGIRIEDLLVVTDGAPEVLSTTTKSLILL